MKKPDGWTDEQFAEWKTRPWWDKWEWSIDWRVPLISGLIALSNVLPKYLP